MLCGCCCPENEKSEGVLPPPKSEGVLLAPPPPNRDGVLAPPPPKREGKLLPKRDEEVEAAEKLKPGVLDWPNAGAEDWPKSEAVLDWPKAGAEDWPKSEGVLDAPLPNRDGVEDAPKAGAEVLEEPKEKPGVVEPKRPPPPELDAEDAPPPKPPKGLEVPKENAILCAAVQQRGLACWLTGAAAQACRSSVRVGRRGTGASKCSSAYCSSTGASRGCRVQQASLKCTLRDWSRPVMTTLARICRAHVRLRVHHDLLNARVCATMQACPATCLVYHRCACLRCVHALIHAPCASRHVIDCTNHTSAQFALTC